MREQIRDRIRAGDALMERGLRVSKFAEPPLWIGSGLLVLGLLFNDRPTVWTSVSINCMGALLNLWAVVYYRRARRHWKAAQELMDVHNVNE